jgi:hypothetical protein
MMFQFGDTDSWRLEPEHPTGDSHQIHLATPDTESLVYSAPVAPRLGYQWMIGYPLPPAC